MKDLRQTTGMALLPLEIVEPRAGSGARVAAALRRRSDGAPFPTPTCLRPGLPVRRMRRSIRA